MTIRVKLPNGSTIDVNTDDTKLAAAAAKKHWGKIQPSGWDGVNSALRTVRDGIDSVVDNALPNWGGEIEGAKAAIAAPFMLRNPVTEFSKANKTFDQSQAAYRRAHPSISTGTSLAGMAASMLLPGGAAVKGAKLASRAAQAGKVGALYGAMAGAGEGGSLSERAENALGNAVGAGAFGVLSVPAFHGVGALSQQARLRVPGVDAVASKVGDGLQRVANKGRALIGRPALPAVPPSVRAQPKANRMLANVIDRGPIRNGAPVPHAPIATPSAVADEVERRAAMNVPAMVGEVTAPLTHTTGWASRGPGPGQQMVRDAIANKKAAEAARLRQHVVDTMGPVVDPIAQMETHMATARSAAAPGYRAAYADPMVVTPEIEAIMGTPAFRAAVPHAVRNIRNAMGDPTALGFRMDPHGNIEGASTLSTEGFDQVIRAMRDNGRAAAEVNPLTGKVTNNSNSVHINARAGDLRDQLSAQNPAYADVTGRYADDMAVRDAFHQGQDVAKLSGHEVNAQARALPDSAHESWAIGARSAMADGASTYAAAHPNGDGAGHLRAILGDDIKQDALGQLTGNTGAVRSLQDRLNAEQQGHALWQEARRNEGATRRSTTDSLDAQMGGSGGPGALNWRGKAGQWIGGMLDKAEPQYAKDVRDHVARVVTEQDPAIVRSLMADVAAQNQKDADRAALIQAIQIGGIKSTYGVRQPYPADD